MIRTGLARWHAMTAACRDRTTRELSNWSRSTLIAVIGFGCILMLMGSLLTFAMAYAGYDQLERRGVAVDHGGYGEIVGVWVVALLLLLGGNSVRVLGWNEWQRRRGGGAHPAIGSGAQRAVTTGVMSLLLSPIMLLWGGMGLVSFHTWIERHLLGAPVFAWPRMLRFFDATAVANMSVWWLLTLAWLGGGVSLIWRGIQVLSRRPASDL